MILHPNLLQLLNSEHTGNLFVCNYYDIFPNFVCANLPNLPLSTNNPLQVDIIHAIVFLWLAHIIFHVSLLNSYIYPFI